MERQEKWSRKDKIFFFKNIDDKWSNILPEITEKSLL